MHQEGVIHKVNKTKKSKTPTIYGGYDASQAIANYVAYVLVVDKNGRQGTCTGIVISDDQILTNAHCFYANGYPSVRNVRIWVGHRRFSSMTTRNVYSVWAVHVYEDYDEKNTFGDLAIVTISNYFPSSQKIARISSRSLNLRTIVNLAGYGEVNGGSNPRALQTTQLQFVADKSCKFRPGVKYWVLNSQRCFNTPSNARSPQTSCFGDSGGPIFYMSSSGTMWVYAVNSYIRGSSCGQWNTLTVGMDLRYFRSAIEESTGYDYDAWEREL